jgi:inhibitor of KinA sporulation pathway (predicted exonuclease)
MESAHYRKLLIVDLEATCWEKPIHRPEQMEIIEIGALLIEIANSTVIEEFDLFVRPVRHPALSDFCKDLTSINQDDVDAANTFPDVMEQFLSWMGNPRDILFASWGAYDQKQLRQDCAYHRVHYPFGDNHLNLKKTFAERHRGKKFGLNRALRLLGLSFEGIHHRGIDDARNIWRIVSSITDGNLTELFK